MTFLLPQHRKLLTDSAISHEVIEARGYRSVEKKAELKRYYGFSMIIGQSLIEQLRADKESR